MGTLGRSTRAYRLFSYGTSIKVNAQPLIEESHGMGDGTDTRADRLSKECRPFAELALSENMNIFAFLHHQKLDKSGDPLTLCSIEFGKPCSRESKIEEEERQSDERASKRAKLAVNKDEDKSKCNYK